MHKIATIGTNFNYRKYNKMFGSKCKIYNANRQDKVKIGNYVKCNTTLACGRNGKISIGDYSMIRSGGMISADNEIKIGNYCMIGTDVQIYDHNGHPGKPALRRVQLESLHLKPIDTNEAQNAKVTIGNDVGIATCVVILKGVTIGDGAMVGAGSVVYEDIPAGTMAAGNPARVITTFDKSLYYEK